MDNGESLSLRIPAALVTLVAIVTVIIVAIVTVIAVAVAVLVVVPIVAIIVTVILFFFFGQIIDRVVEVLIMAAVANLVVWRSNFEERSGLMERAGGPRGGYSSLVIVVIVTVAVAVFIVTRITISPVMRQLRVKVGNREAGRQVFARSV